jgi:FkbM family methyltransferase
MKYQERKMFLKKDKKSVISIRERKRLKKFSRYCQITTTLYGYSVIANDACTLLSDINEILDKEIYKFETNEKCPIIIDCGSNIGISIIYFKHLYPQAKIIAFEPDPIIFNLLSRNIFNFSFKDVELHQAAVWINSFGVNFQTEGGHSGRISEKSNDKDIIFAPSIRLKNILDAAEYIDLLKLDIEGAENEVLFDCGLSLKKCKYIFIEYHSENDKPQELHNILSLFFQMGYRYHICEAFARKHPFIDKNNMLNMDLQLNLFFMKNNI